MLFIDTPLPLKLNVRIPLASYISLLLNVTLFTPPETSIAPRLSFHESLFVPVLTRTLFATSIFVVLLNWHPEKFVFIWIPAAVNVSRM